MNALRILFPATCVGCGSPADDDGLRDLCDRCALSVTPLDPNACPICALPGIDDDLCVGCLLDPPGFERAHASLEFSGVVADAIRRAKYGPDLACWRAVVSWAQDSVTEQLEHVRDLGFRVTWVPMAPAAARDRGFDPPAIALEWLGFRPVTLLRRRDSRNRVAELGAPSRLDAARALFSVTGPVPLDICIFDDVMTTGATLRACSEALLAAGARSVVCITLARTPRWSM